ncbi:site-specific integrase [Cryobacterium sp. M23]|uniref:tyrosine-type recombinase/integrase n=1 Tax=Cryobacterium sp. M23 TaxID=2048292 RepID=UPI000CE48567|nr:site-specific integrase [Cryobacterium sp. M23]
MEGKDMNNPKTTRANFGTVRQLKSKRWQARYPREDGGLRMPGPTTFKTSKEAHVHIANVQSDRARGVYHDPRKGERHLTIYAREWIENGGSRGKLAIRTTELYEDLLVRHVAPNIGKRAVGQITPAMVRGWYTALGKELAERAARPRADGGERVASGKTRQRQAYAFLKGVMNTAKTDGMVGSNPCQIIGAGMVRTEERPFMPMEDFTRLLESHPADLQPVIALAFGAHLRLGEAVALQRSDLDLEKGTLKVVRQAVQTRRTGVVVTPTKTEDTRSVDLPLVTVEAMILYLASVPRALPAAPLFTRSNGKALTRAQLQHAFKKSRDSTDLRQYHFHDLRHSGLTLAAQSGATVRELMARAGHSTSSAAMKYQHAAEERGRIIADGMSAAMRTGMNRPPKTA